MLLFSLWASWPPSTAAYEEISLYISGWTYQSDSFARNGVAKGYCGHCHQQYGESSAWHGNLSTQEHPYLEQTRYIKEESTLAVLEDNLPHIKLDSMIMGTIEMELIEVYYIWYNNYHTVKRSHHHWLQLRQILASNQEDMLLEYERVTSNQSNLNCIYVTTKVDGWL